MYSSSLLLMCSQTFPPAAEGWQRGWQPFCPARLLLRRTAGGETQSKLGNGSFAAASVSAASASTGRCFHAQSHGAGHRRS